MEELCTHFKIKLLRLRKQAKQHCRSTLDDLIFDFSLVIFYNICFHFVWVNGFHFHILQYVKKEEWACKTEAAFHFNLFCKSRPCVYVLAKQIKQYAILKNWRHACGWLSFLHSPDAQKSSGVFSQSAIVITIVLFSYTIVANYIVSLSCSRCLCVALLAQNRVCLTSESV